MNNKHFATLLCYYKSPNERGAEIDVKSLGNYISSEERRLFERFNVENDVFPSEPYIQIVIKKQLLDIEKSNMLNAILEKIIKYTYKDKWPSDDEWKEILPKDFVNFCHSYTLSDVLKSDDLWHFESWVDAIRNRGWLWHSSLKNEKIITIILDVQSFPYHIEAFEFLLYYLGIEKNNYTITEVTKKNILFKVYSRFIKKVTGFFKLR